MIPTSLEELWQIASRSPRLGIKTDNRTLLRQQLYRTMPKPKWSIVLPEEPKDEVWICQKSQ
jgi:hypothetical protein